MLNAKGISVLLAIALSGSSFAGTPAEFKFPTKRLVKDDEVSSEKSKSECDLICHYGLEKYRAQLSGLEQYSVQITHSLVGLTTFVVGYVLAYNIHAVKNAAKSPARGRSKTPRGRNR